VVPLLKHSAAHRTVGRGPASGLSVRRRIRLYFLDDWVRESVASTSPRTSATWSAARLTSTPRPIWGGPGRRLATPLRFDRTTVGGSQARRGQRSAGDAAPAWTRAARWFWSIGPAAERNGAGW